MNVKVKKKMKKRGFVIFLSAVAIAAVIIGVMNCVQTPQAPETPSTTHSSATSSATAAATEATNSSTEAPVTTTASSGSTVKKLLNVEPLLQDNYPSGCEIYASVTLLNYYGFSVDDIEFVENYLHAEPISNDGESEYAPSLYSAFAGSPEFGYGVYAPSLKSSIDQYLSDYHADLTAKTESNCTLDDLCKRHINSTRPVIIWGTTDMEEPYDYIDWIIDYADDQSSLKKGDTFHWPTTEHCMVLVGYDEEQYYFADSLDATVVSYPKEPCEQAFKALGSQAIYLA